MLYIVLRTQCIILVNNKCCLSEVIYQAKLYTSITNYKPYIGSPKENSMQDTMSGYMIVQVKKKYLQEHISKSKTNKRK